MTYPVMLSVHHPLAASNAAEFAAKERNKKACSHLIKAMPTDLVTSLHTAGKADTDWPPLVQRQPSATVPQPMSPARRLIPPNVHFHAEPTVIGNEGLLVHVPDDHHDDNAATKLLG